LDETSTWQGAGNHEGGHSGRGLQFPRPGDSADKAKADDRKRDSPRRRMVPAVTYDVIIVGGGIVGLATALQLLRATSGCRLLLLEKEDQLGMHQTGHNSGVIHSGLYYKPGSLKAKNCIEGYQLLLDFCQEEGIPHDICGKVVVATCEEELPQLEELRRRGEANGLAGLRKLNSAEIKEIEPHCTGIKGLFVPQTGIVNFRMVAEKYAEKIRGLGGEILLGQQVECIVQTDSGVEVSSTHRSWRAKKLVTCAGLYSDRLAHNTTPSLPLRIIPFRGEYYMLKPEARKLVRNLIYPVPDPAFPFLGVHFTQMIDGGVECGPNAVFAFAREGYKKTDFNLRDTMESLAWPGFRTVVRKYWRAGMGEFHRSVGKTAFVKALQRLIPEIENGHLEAGGSGVRAQACDRDGRLLDDFYFVENRDVIHVCNAPSPAATASLAIGANIAKTVIQMLSK
jgi:L-2-hydroxyglutarate oxidase